MHCANQLIVLCFNDKQARTATALDNLARLCYLNYMVNRTRDLEQALTDEKLKQVRFVYCRTMGLSEEDAYIWCNNTFNQINAYMELQRPSDDLSEWPQTQLEEN